MPAIITQDKNAINNGPIDRLPETKVKNGMVYKLVKRNNKVAMYSLKFDQIDTGMKKGILGYEVFEININKPYSIKQKNGSKEGMWYQYPKTERFCGNEDFGRIAWAYSTFESAEKKYNEIS
jgi:hypothetical protein